MGIIAVTSWCIMAYMLPVVAWIVWRRRKRDPGYMLPAMYTIDYTREWGSSKTR